MKLFHTNQTETTLIPIICFFSTGLLLRNAGKQSIFCILYDIANVLRDSKVVTQEAHARGGEEVTGRESGGMHGQ